MRQVWEKEKSFVKASGRVGFVRGRASERRGYEQLMANREKQGAESRQASRVQSARQVESRVRDSFRALWLESKRNSS
jgi:hypothetical protein